MKKKILIALAALLIILCTGIGIVLKNSYMVPVLMYHSIAYNGGASKLIVRPEKFAEQMEFLRERHYNVVGLEDIIRYIEKKEPVPPKTVAITLDDGYQNNYKNAYPILRQYNMPATIFVIVNNIGKPGYLNWKELKEMSDSGLVTIGSHTMSHPFLNSINPDEAKRELVESKAALEKELGRKVDFLCYPAGRFNPEIEKMAREAGYKCAVATNPGPGVSNSDIYAIKRIKISPTSDTLIVFWLKSSGYYNFIRETTGK